MDRVTQQNAANSEESAAASEEMSSQAQELNHLLATFNLNGQKRNEGRGINTGPSKHTVQKAKKVVVGRFQKPETVIPMDEDNEFKDAEFKDF